MGFQFALEAVLRVRVIAEEQEERVLQQILLDIAKTQESITRIDQQIISASQQRQSGLTEAQPGVFVQALYQEEAMLKAQRVLLLKQLEQLAERRNHQVKLYENARRNREMLTDMKSAQKAEYEASISRSEQRTLDDNFIARRGR